MTSPFNAPRKRVDPPKLVPRQYGLLSVVEPRDDSDPHWQNGVIFQMTCGIGGLYRAANCVTGSVGAPKTSNVTVNSFSTTTIVPYAEIDCSPVGGSPETDQQRAMDALDRVQEYQIEQAFWTGAADGGAIVTFPHLAANAQVLDPVFSSTQNVRLQLAATVVTGAVIDPVEALGRLEDALGDCVQGRGIIHVTVTVFDALADHFLVSPTSGRMQTARGNLVAVGDGYTGSAPDGTSTPGVHYMYATPPIFAYRSAPGLAGVTFKESFDRATNTAKLIAERVCVLGYGCCLLAIPVSIGGNATGAYNSAS